MNSTVLKTLPFTIAAFVFVYQAVQQMRQDLIYNRAQAELSFWGQGNYQPMADTVRDTGDAIDSLLQERPAHPDFLTLEAAYFSWLAFWSKRPGAREELSLRAVSSQNRAVSARPAHQKSWSKVAAYASRTADGQRLVDESSKRIETLKMTPRAGRL